MATITRTRLKNNTVDATARGMDINQQDRGDWLQNLYLQNGSLNVREGFGQVTRINSSLTTKSNISDVTSRGFRKVLGSHYINTDFGHEQIITVLLSVVWSADQNARGASTKNLYSVVIYDITTDTKKEILLYTHTPAVQSEQVPLFNQHAHYETNTGFDAQEWVEGIAEKCYFTEFADRLFFGTPTAGPWFYTPGIFSDDEKNVYGTVTKTFDAGQHESTFRAEDGLVRQVILNENKQFSGESVNEDGSLSILETYVTPQQLGPVVDATTFYGRVVYASGRSIFISDQNKPNSVAAQNTVVIDSEENITAIQALRDSIIIWTDNETYLFLPSTDPFAITNGARLYQVSKNIGCLSCQAKQRVGDSVLWVDRNGFWTNSGNVTTEKISTPLDTFFNTYISRPLTNFFKNDGGKVGQDGQKINIDTTGNGIHVSYEPEENRVFFVFPDENFAWVLEGGGFKLWTWKTIANNGVATDISETENIKAPYVVPDGKGGIYLTGGVDTEIVAVDDRGLTFVNEGAFYILEWKRGGGVDRTNVAQEDKVNFIGEYVPSDPHATNDTAKVVIDKPIAVPENTPIYSHNNADAAPYLAEENCFLVPFRWLGSTVGIRQLIQSIDVEFTFDNTNFEFVYDPTAGNPAEVLAVVPTERNGSAWGWSLGRSIFAAPFSYVATTAGGSPTVGANTISLRFSGSVGFATNPWSYPDGAGGGYMNTAADTTQTLLYLVMKKVGNGNDPNFTASIATSFFSYTDSAAASYDIGSIIWRGTPYDDRTMTTDEKQQPVEWVYKTKQIGDGDNQIKARGITATMVSTGRADTSIFPNWVYGLYNSLLGSDQKEWATQVVDLVDPNGQQDKNIQNIKRIVNKDTTIPRLRRATGQPTVNNAYGSSAATWASTAAGDDGTVLSSNNAENNITQSDSVRGGKLSYTLFGFVRNKAEKLRFNALKVAIRAVGAMRRR